jgi:hypothetical protein
MQHGLQRTIECFKFRLMDVALVSLSSLFVPDAHPLERLLKRKPSEEKAFTFNGGLNVYFSSEGVIRT